MPPVQRSRNVPPRRQSLSLQPAVTPLLLFCLASGLSTSGCRGTGSSSTKMKVEAAPQVDPSSLLAAQKLYEARCAPCHGISGNSDGEKAAQVRPRPQRLSDRMWQLNASNERIRKVIVYGGGAVHKSNVMPASPDLAQQPQLLDGLVAVLRSFLKP